MTIIPNFQSLDALLNEADAVVVATVRNLVPRRGRGDFVSINGSGLPYECYIQQTLKGGLAPGPSVILVLGDDFDNFPGTFREGTTAIFFLRKQAEDKWGAQYSSLRGIGATIQIAPVGTESVSQAGAPKQRIKALIRHYRQYRDKQLRREEDLLVKILRS